MIDAVRWRLSQQRRQFLLSLTALAVAPHAGAVSISKPELRVLVNAETPATLRILEALRARFPTLMSGADVRALAQRKGQAIYVAIGPAALLNALDADVQGPIVSVFTSRQTFHKSLGASPRNRQVMAIYAEASPESQLELIAAIYQRRISVGVLLTDTTAPLEADLKRSATKLNLELMSHRLRPEANVLRELPSLSSATVLLALPDSNVFSVDNLRSILESTYRRGQPVVGFSPSMVNAGTLAAAYASSEDVLAHLELLLSDLEAGRPGESQYPMFWRVVANQTVARSLNVLVPDEVRTLGKSPPPVRSR